MDKISDFTPVSDKLIQEYDLLTAVVYGKVWRYCHQKDQCTATLERLASELGVSRRTVERRVKYLVDGGYLIRIKRQGKPNILKITNKIGYETAVKETENDTGDADQEGCVRESQVVRQKGGKGASESRTNIQVNKQDKKPKDSLSDAQKLKLYETKLLLFWGRQFPDKSHPRNGTYRHKIKTRMKSQNWMDNLRPALEKASKSHHLNTSGWFQFEYIVRNHQNIFGILEGRFDGFDRDHNTEPDTIKEWLEEYEDE